MDIHSGHEAERFVCIMYVVPRKTKIKNCLCTTFAPLMGTCCVRETAMKVSRVVKAFAIHIGMYWNILEYLVPP